MKEQTAVEWLEDKIINERRVILNDENYRLFKKAKKMEKQQIKEAYLRGVKNYDPTFKSE